jgi:hypothetical protein
MARLAFGRSGAGAPLVLLHALGLSRHTCHVPMSDNPGAVTALILGSTARERSGSDSRGLWG